MRNRKMGLNLLLFSLALAVAIGTQVVQGPDAMATRVNPDVVCPNGSITDESGPTWEATAAEGLVILDAVIKSGNETTTFTDDGTDGCYTVTGLGTCHAEVTGGGTGRDCKEVSHVVFCTGPGSEPCGSPEPSPEPSSDPTPEPTPEP